MAIIYIKREEIEGIIRSYSKVNETFRFVYYITKKEKSICKFFLNAKECKIDIFHKVDDTTNLLPRGKNIDDSNILIEYISGFGHSSNAETKQPVFYCSEEIINDLIHYLREELFDRIDIQATCDTTQQLYRLKGYNRDPLNLFFYPTTKKAMLQGKPLEVYHIVLNFLLSTSEIPADILIKMNGSRLDFNGIRKEIRSRLGDDLYSYLGETVIKSISGSISSLDQIKIAEDYTGTLTGVFKALESYLCKVLIEYGFEIGKPHRFHMFKGGPKIILKENRVAGKTKEKLEILYSLYSNKRNVFLHGSSIPSQTRLVETKEESENLLYEILTEMRDSYETFIRS